MSSRDDNRSYLFALIYLALAIVCAGLAVIFWTQMGNRQVGLKNQTYQAASLCLFSVPYSQRTPDYIKGCYAQAERMTGQTIERFGDAK